MGTPETSREPCPDRILDDIGGAFGMGAVGGSAFHFIKGSYNSPKGSRFVGGTQSVSMNAPRTGGSFAVWGGLFSTFDCSMVYLRQKEDPWNSIIAGAATGGFLSMRQGLGAASRSAVFGGVLLALIEGAGIMLNKLLSQPQHMMMEEPVPGMPPGMPGMQGVPGMQGMQGMPGMQGRAGMQMGQMQNQAQMMSESQNQNTASSSSSSSWFGGLFGKKNEEVQPGSGSKTEVLESFDAPPVPSFEYK
ncbi:PREDICTED: mitochondrial import inner membrane translocase subunit TIM17-2 [Camelina sativa]|uniref:Mitochondrial import inner membrane translocase subunit TIM17-2 n=1 Tax=Camelina sativa TaxID=90675 RepID=A0ABM0Z233_CAMSA|nr:PREDICTED: mitochondrial import inner membrane translocase subunit TIM17-2 [Camelina sativa]